MGDYVEKTVDFFTFEKEGAEIEGILVGVEEVMIQDNPVKRYILQAGADLKAFLGGVQLDSLMMDVELNTAIKVQYTGKTTSKSGRPVNQYRLWVKEGE